MKPPRVPLFQIALTANLFEWYEFSLSGFMALAIGRRFFPATGDTTALLLSFSVFAGSYLVRPLGCIVWGYWSDRRGTPSALNASMVTMAVPAALIGCLPTYESVGYWATLCLVLLKLVQGFGAGGEAPLSGYYVALHTAGNRRGTLAALAASSAYLGMLLASAVVWVLPHFSTWLAESMPPGMGDTAAAQSWRWPFLVCLPLSIWIVSLRARLGFAAPHSLPHQRQRRPLWPLIQAAIIVALMGVTIYTELFWLPTYLESDLGVSHFEARASNVCALIVLIGSITACGYVVRWISAARIALFGTTAIILWCYPLFASLQHANLLTLILTQSAMAAMAGCLSGVFFVLVTDLLKDHWQGFGMAMAYTLPMSFFGGTAPLVNSYLLAHTQQLMAPAIYMILMGLIAFPVLFRLSLKAHVDQAPKVTAAF